MTASGLMAQPSFEAFGVERVLHHRNCARRPDLAFETSLTRHREDAMTACDQDLGRGASDHAGRSGKEHVHGWRRSRRPVAPMKRLVRSVGPEEEPYLLAVTTALRDFSVGL